jgi:PAS domain S-box-containing protein
MRTLKKEAIRYALAALAAIAALALRYLLDPLLGDKNPYHTLWLAIVFTAWYCGIGPSILASAIGLMGLKYWFLPPYHSFGTSNAKEVFGMLGFLVFSGVIVGLGESTRRHIQRRQQAEDGLREAQKELEDRVTERTAELEQRTAEVVEKATLLDLANDAIFIRRGGSIITYWNQGAERLYGWSMEEARGKSTYELLKTEFPIPLHEIESKQTWEGELRHSKRDGNQIIVASRWTRLQNDKDGKAVGWLEINTDITARKRAEDAARSLSGRILNLQDEERRRIARELHDSLGQYLTALKLNLSMFGATNGSQARLATECSDILDKCLVETRTISHLLHPPLLDEVGFGSAAKWYVEGFAQRSGIQVNLDLDAKLGRLASEVEIGLFRAVQEALTNVHRHSGGTSVEIRLKSDGENIFLEIVDNGCGIAPERLSGLNRGDIGAGVGIAGMRERVRDLNGTVEIQSSPTGTRVMVAIPVPEGRRLGVRS